jgi:hypothetical protein
LLRAARGPASRLTRRARVPLLRRRNVIHAAEPDSGLSAGPDSCPCPVGPPEGRLDLHATVPRPGRDRRPAARQVGMGVAFGSDAHPQDSAAGSTDARLARLNDVASRGGRSARGGHAGGCREARERRSPARGCRRFKRPRTCGAPAPDGRACAVDSRACGHMPAGSGRGFVPARHGVSPRAGDRRLRTVQRRRRPFRSDPTGPGPRRTRASPAGSGRGPDRVSRRAAA